MDRILLAAPHSIHKNYCFIPWLVLAKSFGVDIFISDNSPGNENAEMYESLGVDFEWVNPEGKTSEEFICESQNQIRNRVIEKGYSHLFSLETDLLPPKTILPFLFTASKHYGLPVVSAPYFIYKNRHSQIMNQEIRIIGFEGYTRNYSLKESFGFQDGDIHQCYSTGFGCTLIRKDVLEKLEFRSEPDQWVAENEIGRSHADSYFYADLQRLNIPSYLYTGIVVRHYNSDWSKIRSQVDGK
jgi:hypothetical protein